MEIAIQIIDISPVFVSVVRAICISLLVSLISNAIFSFSQFIWNAVNCAAG